MKWLLVGLQKIGKNVRIKQEKTII